MVICRQLIWALAVSVFSCRGYRKSSRPSQRGCRYSRGLRFSEWFLMLLECKKRWKRSSSLDVTVVEISANIVGSTGGGVWLTKSTRFESEARISSACDTTHPMYRLKSSAHNASRLRSKQPCAEGVKYVVLIRDLGMKDRGNEKKCNRARCLARTENVIDGYFEYSELHTREENIARYGIAASWSRRAGRKRRDMSSWRLQGYSSHHLVRADGEWCYNLSIHDELLSFLLLLSTPNCTLERMLSMDPSSILINHLSGPNRKVQSNSSSCRWFYGCPLIEQPTDTHNNDRMGTLDEGAGTKQSAPAERGAVWRASDEPLQPTRAHCLSEADTSNWRVFWARRRWKNHLDNRHALLHAAPGDYTVNGGPAGPYVGYVEGVAIEETT